MNLIVFPEWIHSHNDSTTMTTSTKMYSKQVFRTSSCKNVPDDRFNASDSYRNRDSGTSSPQPQDTRATMPLARSNQVDVKSKISLNVEYFDIEPADESDSNDSVFSSSSSVDSNNQDGQNTNATEVYDLYLGGSCMLRTKWRTELAIPMLNQKGITYHLPTLHESICSSVGKTVNLNEADALPMEKDGNDVPKLRTKKLSKTKPVRIITDGEHEFNGDSQIESRKSMFNPAVMESCRVLLFVITNETRSLAPMTLAAHYIGLGYNVVLCVQMLPEFCVIGNDRVTIILSYSFSFFTNFYISK